MTGYVRAGFGSVIHNGVGITHVGHPAAPYLSLSSGYIIWSTCIAQLGQHLPVKIEDKNILPKNLVRQISQAVNS